MAQTDEAEASAPNDDETIKALEGDMDIDETALASGEAEDLEDMEDMEPDSAFKVR